MTSNGNQVQKILIAEMINVCSNVETAFKNALKKVNNEEQKQTLLNIARKFNVKI